MQDEVNLSITYHCHFSKKELTVYGCIKTANALGKIDDKTPQWFWCTLIALGSHY